MADGKISVDFNSDTTKLLRDLAAQEAKNRELEQQLRRVKAGYDEVGQAGGTGMDRVTKATDAAAKAKWEQERAIRQVKKGWEEEAKAAEQSGEASQEMTQAGTAGIGRMTAALGGFVAGLASMRTAINLAKAEYENLLAMQGKAKDVQISTASSRMDVMRNMVGAPDAQLNAALEATREIARSRGMREADVNQALAAALSASGGNISASVQAVSGAARVMPDRPQDMAMYAGAMLDLSKVTGTENAAVNQGLLAFVGAQSRVTDLQLQAQHVPKALIGVQGFGGTPAESTALFAALSMAGGDRTGATTGTASIKLAQQLREFLPAAGVAATTKGGLSDLEQAEYENLLGSRSYRQAIQRRDQGLALRDEDLRVLKQAKTFEKRAEQTVIPGRPGMATFGERLAYLQANPEMARQFLGQASFEAAMSAPIEQLLLNPQSVAAQQYRKNLASMPSLSALAEKGRGVVAGFGRDPLFQQAERSRAYASAEERLLLDDLVGAEGAINREGLERVLRASGKGDLATRLDMIRWEWGSDIGREGGTPEAIDLIQQRRQKLMAPTERITIAPGSDIPAGSVRAPSTGGFGMGMQYDVPRAPTPTEQRQADILGEVLAVLQRIEQQGGGAALEPKPARELVDR